MLGEPQKNRSIVPSIDFFFFFDEKFLPSPQNQKRGQKCCRTKFNLYLHLNLIFLMTNINIQKHDMSIYSTETRFSFPIPVKWETRP